MTALIETLAKEVAETYITHGLPKESTYTIREATRDVLTARGVDESIADAVEREAIDKVFSMDLRP